MTATALDYQCIFDLERTHQYPLIDKFEERMGYAIDRAKLEQAARVLACPVKRNPPNWQHGRVLYASARRYIDDAAVVGELAFLDIGTAKGFSALCLRWAQIEARAATLANVVSVDVIDPMGRVPRNTIADVDGPKTLAETLAPWPEAQSIRFVQSTGIAWLEAHPDRLHVVFVDGKHTADAVATEAALIRARQVAGDLCIFDDVHLPEIAKVVNGLASYYTLERIDVLPTRAYMVGVRR